MKSPCLLAELAVDDPTRTAALLREPLDRLAEAAYGAACAVAPGASRAEFDAEVAAGLAYLCWLAWWMYSEYAALVGRRMLPTACVRRDN
jgi:hypothetical protein